MRISNLNDFIFETAKNTGSEPKRMHLHHLDIADVTEEILRVAEVLPKYEPILQTEKQPGNEEIEPGWVMKFKGIPIYRDSTLARGSIR